MPYCRKCGTKLEENAQFCPNCGTPVATYTYPPAPPPAHRPMRSEPLVIAGIVLVAILISAVIISILIFAPINVVNLGQTNEINQPNVKTLNLNFYADIAQVNIIAQNVSDRTIVMYTSGNVSTGIFGSKNPVQISFTNETLGKVLTVNAKIAITDRFTRAQRVICDIYLNPSMLLNLNITTQTGLIKLNETQHATFESLNLKSNTGEVQADLQNGTVIEGDISLKTSTGVVMFSMNQANVEGNRTFNLQTNTGKVNMDINEKQTLPGNVQMNASTNTGSVDLSMIIDDGVAARIESRTDIGSIRTNVNNFSGNKSPIQSNNYPAESNFIITLKTNIGSININASYQSTTISA